MDDGTFLSAGIAWYSLLSFFPIVLIGMSVLGYLLPPGEALERHSLEIAHIYLPRTLVDYVQVYVEQTLSGLNHDSGHLGVVGVLTLLWSGRHLFRAMELSLHRVWEIPVRRSYISGNILSMVMIVLCGAVTCVVAFVSALLGWMQVALSHVQIPHPAGISLDQAVLWAWIHSWVIIPTASVVIFFLLYLLLPTRQVPVLAAFLGAILAAALLRVASWLYVTCLAKLVALNPLYASIGSLAGLMLWLYVSAVVFLLGAEMVDLIYCEFYAASKEPRSAPRRRPSKGTGSPAGTPAPSGGRRGQETGSPARGG